MRQLMRVSLLLLAATVAEIHSDVTFDCAGKPADVVFMLDASNSIWQPDFKRQLNFIKDVVAFFTIGPRNIMVGVVTYAGFPRLQFHLNSYNRKSDLFAAIDNIHQDGGYETKTSAALRYLRERAFSETFGARPRMAQQVAVIITDGRSDNTTLTAREAAKVKAAGVHLFAVGVGRNLDMEELRLLASDPIDYYTFLVDNYVGLERIKDLLAIKTCAVTDPPSTTTTTTTTAPTTTTITTTTTRRQRRNKLTTMKPTTTTSESTTTSSAANRNDNDNYDEEDDDDNDKTTRGGKYTGDGFDLTDNEDFGPPLSITDNDDSPPSGNDNSNHLGESSVTAGQRENLNPSDKDSDGDPNQVGNDLEHAGGNKTAGGGGDGSESESGKERVSDKDGTGSGDLKSGQNASESGGKRGPNHRPTIRYETPRTLDILQPPLYVPDATQYPYHELKRQNLTYAFRNHSTSEHDGGKGGWPSGHITGPDGENGGEIPTGQNRGLGVYYFDDDGRFQRVNGSESRVDVGQLPKISDDENVYIKGGLIMAEDTYGRRRIVGCEVNGTHYVGKWTAENERKWFYGYRAPDIADRLRNGPSHVIGAGEHRHMADNITTTDDGLIMRKDDDDVTDSSDPSGTGYDRIQVLDPNGESGRWEEDEDGKVVWYLYTCPGVYVPVPDGPPIDEYGKPQLMGQSQCTVPDENGQDVDYIYAPPGQFERSSPSSSSGVVPNANKGPRDDDFFEVKGKKEEVWEDDTNGGSTQGGLESVEINGEDLIGVWTTDVNGSLRPIEGELVDLKLPEIDEDQEFYVRANIVWAKGAGGKLKPIGCIINGTYYVGYWIRKDDGTRMLYGYPSRTLEQRLNQQQPTELTQRVLIERLPTTVEHNGGGHWVVDEDGMLQWFARVSDHTTNANQELKMVERHKYTHSGAEDYKAPDQDVMEYTTTPDEEGGGGGGATGRPGVVLDSNGHRGKWRNEQGKWVWYRYVCPGVYEPIPAESYTSWSLTVDMQSKECTAIDENGELVKYVYQSPGRFEKIRKDFVYKDKDNDQNTEENNTQISKSKKEEGKGVNKTKQGRTRAPGSEYRLHGKTTPTSFHSETEEVTKRPKPGNIHNHKNDFKDPSHRGCRPRKPTDLAFIIDSKRDDETSAGQMWDLTRDILSKLDLDDDRVQVRFVQECGPGTSGLSLGEFDSKESLINALDARIHAPPTSSAQLIRNMADALTRNGNGRGRRRVGVYLTDGASDSMEETLAAAQSAKHADDVEVFAVGVGHGTSPTELRAIASCEIDRHYYAMNHHSKADAIAKKISKVICLGPLGR